MGRALHVVTERSCGECDVCCVFVGIAELDKPPRQRCQHLSDTQSGCTIYESERRPAVCHRFMCAWRRGAGREEDRPDRCGAMVSINAIEGGLFGLALEIRSGAVCTTAAEIVAAVASDTKLPIIISDFESLAPNDKGDRVALHTSILYRSRRLAGRLLTWLAPEVALYELVKGNGGTQ